MPLKRRRNLPSAASGRLARRAGLAVQSRRARFKRVRRVRAAAAMAAAAEPVEFQGDIKGDQSMTAFNYGRPISRRITKWPLPGGLTPGRLMMKLPWRMPPYTYTPAAVTGDIIIRGNSVYDPDNVTRTGYGVDLWTQLSVLYYKYMVHAARVTFIVENVGASAVTLSLAAVEGAPTTTSLGEMIREAHRSMTLAPAGTAAARGSISLYARTKDVVMGQRANLDTLSSDVGSNPTTPWRFNLRVEDPLATTNVSIRVLVKAEYWVEWFAPNKGAPLASTEA